MIRRFSLSHALFLRASDVIVVIVGLALASLIRINVEIGMPGIDAAFGTPPLLFVIASALWLVAFQLLGVYNPAHSAWLAQEIQWVVLGHAVACLLFFGALYVTYRDYSRLQALYTVVLVLVGMVGYRVAVRLAYKITGRNVGQRRNVVIVGTDENAQRIAKTVQDYAWTGLHLLGCLKYQSNESALDSLTILGVVDDLPALVAKHSVNEVIFVLKSPGDASVTRMSRMLDALQYHATNVRIAPDYSDLAYFRVTTENFGGIPLLGLREAVLSPGQRLSKRLFDVAFSALALVFCWPLFLGIALAIRLESRGPVIFRQQRIGEFGRPFTMLKFRTMVEDAEQKQDKNTVDHKQSSDPRVTRVGQFLRRTSLDELPQVVNIFRGEMSLVGPRPEMPWLVEKYEPWQRKRFEVPQGLTGWWQINGRADRPMYLNTEDDLFYIRNYSLWLDMQIILRTLLVVITGRGAY